MHHNEDYATLIQEITLLIFIRTINLKLYVNKFGSHFFCKVLRTIIFLNDNLNKVCEQKLMIH